MDATPTGATPPPDARKTLTTGFLTVAVIEGAVIIAAVVLLTLEVIPFGVFLAIIVACMLGAALGITAVVRRVSKQQQGTASPGGTVERPSSDSTIDPDKPFEQ